MGSSPQNPNRPVHLPAEAAGITAFVRLFYSLPWYARISRLSFAAVFICSLVIAVFCAFDAVHLVGRAFPGFFVSERLMPSNIGRPQWTGPQAGVHFPDVLQKANDTVLKSAADLKSLVTSVDIGTPVLYEIEREGKLLAVSIPTMTFTWTDLSMTLGPILLSGMLYWLLAVVVYILKPDTGQSWALVLMCFFIGGYQVLSFDVSSTHRFVRLALFFMIFIAGALMHLSFLFPERKHFVNRIKSIQVVPYLISAGLVLLAYWSYPGPSFNKVYAVVRIYIALSVIALIVSVIHGYFKSVSLLARQRSKVVLAGAALAFPIPVIVHNLSLFGGTPAAIQVLNTFLAFPVLIFPASVSYAIARHNLFDVDVYLKRTVGYLMMTACVAGGYFVIQSIVRKAVLDPLVGPAAEQLYPLLFALLTVFAFNPLSRTVQGAVDKLFYRKHYDYKATVADISEALTTLTDVKTFIDKVIQKIRADLFIDRAGIVLIDDRSKSSTAIFHGAKFGRETPDADDVRDPCLSPDDPLLALLAQERTMITKYDIAEDPRYASFREVCGQRFEDLGASLTLPLYYHDQFAGVMALGYKKSGYFYTREDIDLLKTISTMTSTAIEQSREKGQKAVLMQLFAKHVSPQVAESLWEQRDHFLEGGRPKSQSMIVTAMFTDLQGFSTISESQDPEMLMKWLNTYLEMMTTTVMEHGGVVDDFFGDGIKINFGVPVPRTTEDDIAADARNAVSCALAMEDKMMGLNSTMVAQGFHALRMRIGIYTGSVVAGSLGSADRMKYTTLGDTVNTAARLESFSKELNLPELTNRPCRILIGDSTRHYLGDRFQLISVGDMELKGKALKIPSFCVLGEKTSRQTHIGSGMIREVV